MKIDEYVCDVCEYKFDEDEFLTIKIDVRKGFNRSVKAKGGELSIDCCKYCAKRDFKFEFDAYNAYHWLRGAKRLLINLLKWKNRK